MMNAPMFDNKYLAHALGGYGGYKYLNNEDALRYAIKQGHRYFEVDLTLTEDGHLVPSHGWNEANAKRSGLEYSPEFEHMTKELFLKQKVHGMPVMDTERLYQYMKDNPDYYWELDLHTIPKDVAVRVTEALLRDFHDDHELFDRFLIQANSPEMFEGIDSVYHFKYYQLFVRRGATMESLAEAVAYCHEHGFCSIALSAKDARKETIGFIRDNGLHVLIYSCDDQKKADSFHAMGASTICTNTLSPRGDRILKLKKSPPVRALRKIWKKVRRLFS